MSNFYDKYIVESKVKDSELKKLSKSFIVDCYNNLEEFLNIPDDIVIFDNMGIFLPFKKESVVKCHKQRDTYDYIPKFLIETFKIIEIDGDYYYTSSDKIAKTSDTGKYKLRDHLYLDIVGHYWESDKNLRSVDHREHYINKEFEVFCEDIQDYDDKRIIGGRDRDNGSYYLFSDFMPSIIERNNHAPYFNLTASRKLNERGFGIEFEFSNAVELTKEIIKHPILRLSFKSTRDGSLDGLLKPTEFVSVPLTYNELKHIIPEFLSIASKTNAKAHDRCGYHVHIGAQDINFHDITSLITFCRVNEKDFFKLVDKNRTNSRYCRKLDERFDSFIEVENRIDKKEAGEKLYKDCRADFENRHDTSKYVDQEEQRGPRYYWLNVDRFYHMRNIPEAKTIEFRNHEVTFNSDDFLGYCLLCYYVVEYARNNSRKTCKNSSFRDILKSVKPIHYKQLRTYLNSKLR